MVDELLVVVQPEVVPADEFGMPLWRLERFFFSLQVSLSPYTATVEKTLWVSLPDPMLRKYLLSKSITKISKRMKSRLFGSFFGLDSA